VNSAPQLGQNQDSLIAFMGLVSLTSRGGLR
jgi:hypothetical protein